MPKFAIYIPKKDVREIERWPKGPIPPGANRFA
jgi:hypothetical protein